MKFAEYGRALAALVLLVSLTSAASAAELTPLTTMPGPAPGSFGIKGTALPDGRLLVWDGQTVYVQDAVGADAFSAVATGYAGDPGFVAPRPNGTLVLGAGFSGDLYYFDPQAPADFTPASILASLSHFAGIFLTQDILLLDAGKADFSGSELVTIDLSAKSLVPRPVVVRGPEYAQPKGLIVEKPPFGYSAALARDPLSGRIYSMDSGALSLRAFDEADIFGAINSSVPLDWDADGRRIGQPGEYLSGGVAGVLASGNLLLSGSYSFGGPGGIQIVDPATGIQTAFFRPFGDRYHDVIYNQVLDQIVAVSENADSAGILTPPAPPAPEDLPAASGFGLAALAFLSVAAGIRATRRR